MKVATHVLAFGQDKWILKNIENAYPHVDCIFVSYSEKPWNYNPQARFNYKNDTTTLDHMISSSPWADKVHILEGEWDTEEDQRNSCADLAKRQGFDILIIHDADEFYHDKEFAAAIQTIRNNPTFDYYTIGWYCFWKSFNYVLVNEVGNPIVGFPQFAINLKNDVKFLAKRKPNKQNVFMIDPLIAMCYHGSYVLTNEEVYQKINTWGHANDFDRERWYKEVWLEWKPEMRDLHLVNPSAWSSAIPFKGILPEVLKDFT